MRTPKITVFGESALLLSWQNTISIELHDCILAWNNSIQSSLKKDLIETVISYCSIAIYFKPGTKLALVKSKLEAIQLSNIKMKQGVTWEVPVCYDTEFGIDLINLSAEKKCTVAEVIALHIAPIYRIYFTGFLPGFLYLGGLDERLYSERKSTPILNVPRGAVAIGGNQTGIYPQNSPGGWKIIGRTPITLFDCDKSPPTPFKPGDQLKFKSITLNDYNIISVLVANGNYNYSSYD